MANFNIDYLIVAGGGAGGGSQLGNYAGGGGGAGGVRTSFTPVSTPANYTILPTMVASTGTAYDITIGAGGIGVASASTKGGSGANSIFNTVTATGGGGGGVGQNDPGLTGGSAGGTAANTTTRTNSVSPTQGFRGGGSTTSSPNFGSGGGGGAGAQGAQGTGSKGGDGGIGFQTAITGTATYYAGGGGGGSYKPPSGATSEMGLGGLGGGGDALVRSVGEPGTDGLGGGGGAATNGDGEGGNRAGGNGGSGIVILRYATADASGYTITGAAPTETTDGTDTILSFTTVGTGTITFTTPIPPFSGSKVTTPVTDFNKPLTEEGLKIPSGTSSNQPTGVTGMVRNDTTQSSEGSSSAISYYNGTNWRYFENQSQENQLILNSVMYYSASNTTSYPGTGTSWFDLSGNANTATITSSNYSNGYFDLTPTSSIITSPVNTLFQTFSFSIWVKFDTVTVASGYAGVVFSKAQFYASNYDAFPINAALSSTGNFEVGLSYGDNYTYNVQNSTTVSANTWYNIAYVADSTANTAKLYIGTESTQLAQTGSTQSYTGTLVTNPNQFYSLGKSPSEYGGGVNKSSLNGKIAKFGFWNTALTQSELITIWGLGSGVS